MNAIRNLILALMLLLMVRALDAVLLQWLGLPSTYTFVVLRVGEWVAYVLIAVASAQCLYAIGAFNARQERGEP